MVAIAAIAAIMETSLVKRVPKKESKTPSGSVDMFDVHVR